jgi:hypothetical protein
LELAAREGHDPLILEKQLAELEYDIARITEQWIGRIRSQERGTQVPIPEQNRDLMSLFIALQFLRTEDARDTLARIAEGSTGVAPTDPERRRLHLEALWDDPLVGGFSDHINSAIWMFGRNDTDIPFVTSDNPVAFRTIDNTMWLKAGVLSRRHTSSIPWRRTSSCTATHAWSHGRSWRRWTPASRPSRSPLDMVMSENSGQVFMGSRFVISSTDGFSR